MRYVIVIEGVDAATGSVPRRLTRAFDAADFDAARALATNQRIGQHAAAAGMLVSVAALRIVSLAERQLPPGLEPFI